MHHPCEFGTLLLDSFVSPALEYLVGGPSQTFCWDDNDVTESITAIDCGPVEFTFDDQLFSFNAWQNLAFDDSVPDIWCLSSTQLGVAGTQNIDIRVKYTNHPLVISTDNAVIADIEAYSTCTPVSVTASTAPSDVVYTIDDLTVNTVAFSEFTVDPTYCPVLYVATYDIQPPSTLITFDSATRVFTIFGTDSSTANTYTVTIRAEDPQGVDTGVSFQFIVTVLPNCASPISLTGIPQADIEYLYTN